MDNLAGVLLGLDGLAAATVEDVTGSAEAHDSRHAAIARKPITAHEAQQNAEGFLGVGVGFVRDGSGLDRRDGAAWENFSHSGRAAGARSMPPAPGFPWLPIRPTLR